MDELNGGTVEHLSDLVERVLRPYAPLLALPPASRWIKEVECSVELQLFCMELLAT